MLTVTKEFSFCYGHHLPNYPGLCKNQHGHNSILKVTVKGASTFDDITPAGMVCDFSFLKKIVKTHIIDVLDHQNLNELDDEGECGVSFEMMNEFKKMIEMPTAENMVQWIVGELKTEFMDDLVSVKLYETPTSYCEWKRSN